MSVELICARGDGFRVDHRYFDRKPKFLKGVCPRCNGPIRRVEAGTDTDTTE